MSEQEAYVRGLMRAAEMCSRRNFFNDGREIHSPAQAADALAAAIFAEADALPKEDHLAQPYVPTIVDYPDAGHAELVLADTLIVWAAPDSNGVEIGWDAERTKRIGVRWRLNAKGGGDAEDRSIAHAAGAGGDGGNPLAPQRQSDGALLQRLGDDASKWAAEFRQTALRLGYADMDEGWLIGWFANAIEHSTSVRRITEAAMARSRGGEVTEAMLLAAQHEFNRADGWKPQKMRAALRAALAAREPAP